MPKGYPGGSDGKESAYNARCPGPVPGSERSPGQGDGNPLQYSFLENPHDRRTWWATVGCSPGGCKELDMTERLQFHSFSYAQEWDFWITKSDTERQIPYNIAYM